MRLKIEPLFLAQLLLRDIDLINLGRSLLFWDGRLTVTGKPENLTGSGDIPIAHLGRNLCQRLGLEAIRCLR